MMDINYIKDFFKKPESYALCLCGGGAKGAYQAGVWRYLVEQGLDKRIEAISGSSIGSLNVLLFSMDKYLSPEEAWFNAKKEHFFEPNKENIISPETREQYAEHKILGRVADLVKHPLEKGAPYSQDAFEKFIRDNLGTEEQIFESGRMLYVTVGRIAADALYDNVNHLPIAGEYICLNGKNREEIINYVLASCAMPPYYPPKRIGDITYYDGGTADNIPIRALVWARFKNIIVIHLRTPDDPIEMERMHNTYEGIDLRGVNIWHIWPSDRDIIGKTMEFSQEMSLARMALGYKDAREQLPIIDSFFGKKLAILPPEDRD